MEKDYTPSHIINAQGKKKPGDAALIRWACLVTHRQVNDVISQSIKPFGFIPPQIADDYFLFFKEQANEFVIGAASLKSIFYPRKEVKWPSAKADRPFFAEALDLETRGGRIQEFALCKRSTGFFLLVRMLFETTEEELESLPPYDIPEPHQFFFDQIRGIQKPDQVYQEQIQQSQTANAWKNFFPPNQSPPFLWFDLDYRIQPPYAFFVCKKSVSGVTGEDFKDLISKCRVNTWKELLSPLNNEPRTGHLSPIGSTADEIYENLRGNEKKKQKIDESTFMTEKEIDSLYPFETV